LSAIIGVAGRSVASVEGHVEVVTPFSGGAGAGDASQVALTIAYLKYVPMIINGRR
jgi:hypothetical protein